MNYKGRGCYIPMGKGFLYLYAIIDVHSRYIVSWGLYSTLEASNAIEVLERAIRRHGVPEIFIGGLGGRDFIKVLDISDIRKEEDITPLR